MFERTISLYHRDGRVFKYDVCNLSESVVEAKVTEHMQRIVDAGWYRHNDGQECELIPVMIDGDRGIYKIKSAGVRTNYPDRTERT